MTNTLLPIPSPPIEIEVVTAAPTAGLARPPGAWVSYLNTLYWHASAAHTDWVILASNVLTLTAASADPRAGAGLAASVGTRVTYGNRVFVKYGTADTAWSAEIATASADPRAGAGLAGYIGEKVAYGSNVFTKVGAANTSWIASNQLIASATVAAGGAQTITLTTLPTTGLPFRVRLSGTLTPAGISSLVASFGASTMVGFKEYLFSVFGGANGGSWTDGDGYLVTYTADPGTILADVIFRGTLVEVHTRFTSANGIYIYNAWLTLSAAPTTILWTAGAATDIDAGTTLVAAYINDDVWS